MTRHQFVQRLATLVTVLLLLLVTAPPGGAETYVAAATFVARTGGDTVVDQGGVICGPQSYAATSIGIGGACIPFDDAYDAIRLSDKVLRTDQIAFQVCVDNDGDGTCGNEPPLVQGCSDDISFSHGDDGSFANPLLVPAADFRAGCPGGFDGWVVFLCTGAHQATENDSHAHPAVTGVIAMTTGGSEGGNFCGSSGLGGPGANLPVVGKPYVVQ